MSLSLPTAVHSAFLVCSMVRVMTNGQNGYKLIEKLMMSEALGELL